MFGSSEFTENRPIGHIGKIPIFVTTIIAALHVIGLCLTGAALGQQVLAYLQPYIPPLVFQGEWQPPRGAPHMTATWATWLSPLSYAFVEFGNLFALLSIVFIYFSGLELEKFYGRWTLIKLYGALLLASPVVATACWLCGYNGRFLLTFGCGNIALALFVGFAVRYPDVEMFGVIKTRTIAILFIVINCVILSFNGDGVGFLKLFVSCGIAATFMMKLRTHGDFAIGGFLRGLLPRRKPRLRVLPSPPPRRTPPPAEMGDSDPVETEVDALLDKIAKSGIDSLTHAERAKLEKASRELQKKDRH